ncbi:MAG: hypothetical protein D4R97_03260 [Bacteroidetes bacterium]|nr:MAG: hypothetical protein D4R97_03260 [Bacteroidota bacterium]
MKTISSTSFTVLWVTLILLSACKKEKSGNQASYEDQIMIMVNKAGSDMNNQEVLTDDSSQTIYMINDGIAADFLADESCMEENEQGNNTEIKFIRDHSFIHCLKGLSLSVTQKAQIKQDLRVYKACTQHAIQRAKTIYHDLREKYQVKYQRLWNAYQNGTITREEFRKKVAELKAAFKKELREMHLKEKLDDALKVCLRKFFKTLHETLSERQWNAFVECYKQ